MSTTERRPRTYTSPLALMSYAPLVATSAYDFFTPYNADVKTYAALLGVAGLGILTSHNCRKYVSSLRLTHFKDL